MTVTGWREYIEEMVLERPSVDISFKATAGITWAKDNVKVYDAIIMFGGDHCYNCGDKVTVVYNNFYYFEHRRRR